MIKLKILNFRFHELKLDFFLRKQQVELKTFINVLKSISRIFQ